jgi:glycosyltransferase involved in cell wall biosynthesis
MQNKKLKILNIISNYYPIVGGAEKECHKLSLKLKEMGHDVTVLTSYKDNLIPHEIIDGIPVYRKIRGWHLYELTYIISVFVLLFRFRKKFDHVICFGLHRFTVPAIIFCRLTGKKVFFRVESARETGDIYSMQQLKFGNLILSFSKLAHGAIIISNEIEKELLKIGFPQKKITKIPNTVDTNKFFPKIKKNEAQPLTINFIGRLHQKKGVDILINAIKKLKDKSFDFRVSIVGDGPLKKDLTMLVNNLKLEDRIFFTGTQKEPLPFYQQADIIAMPSYAEGLPLVLLEAMACKAAIVATEIGGITDVIVKKSSGKIHEKSFCICENGILVLPGDIEGLTIALEQLIQDRRLREELSQKAYETVLESYTLDKVILRYLDLFGSNSL